jgi:tetraacyldisaccharide 4'-kinase
VSYAAQNVRQVLWPLGLVYGALAAARNWTFARGVRAQHRLPVTVVSIGNLTVGGTGKTPTVAWLCELARAHGRTPGVLARGYARAPGALLNDEGAMLQAQLPWLLQVQDPDRVAGGNRLVKLGADFIVLDDGFQHRRLQRDVDLVCLDAARPFGNGSCLPAGDLREFCSGLQRADLVLLTRASAVSKDQLAALTARVKLIARAPALPVFAADHAPSFVQQKPGGMVLPLASLHGQRAVLLTAVAQPLSVRTTAESLGVQVVRELRYRDHHQFTHAEVDAAAAAARNDRAIVLTTAKDDARLSAYSHERQVLHVGLRFLSAVPLTTMVGLA